MKNCRPITVICRNCNKSLQSLYIKHRIGCGCDNHAWVESSRDKTRIGAEDLVRIRYTDRDGHQVRIERLIYNCKNPKLSRWEQ